MGRLVLLVTSFWIRAVCQDPDSGPVDLHVAGLFPMDGWYPAGQALLTAVNMALDDVNRRPDILPGYRLNLHWRNSQCVPRVATKALYDLLNDEPAKMFVLGPATSDVSEATAQISYVFNVTQLSPVSVSPTLSDKQKYPWFFRMNVPELKVNPVRVAFLQEFGWKKIAIIYQSVSFLMDAKNELEMQLRSRNVTILSCAEYIRDAYMPLAEIQKVDARIIFTFLLESTARDIFCQIHKMGLDCSKHVWVVLGWYEDRWWTADSSNNCTAAEMTHAVEGVFAVGAYYKNHVEERGIANVTALEFQERFVKYSGGASTIGVKYGPAAYDSVWAIAMAISDAKLRLQQTDSAYKLEDFSYHNTVLAQLLKRSLQNVKITGVKGCVAFDDNGDLEGPVQIHVIRGGVDEHVGSYNRKEGDVAWCPNISAIFQDSGPPRDSTLVKTRLIFVPRNVYLSMCALAGMGILSAVAFLIINILWREIRIIKMSAPNLNNLILVGCIISYLSVFFQDVSSTTAHAFCKLYILLKSSGFSLTFGALFAKTWRIYIIFSNKTVQKKIIKDTRLIIIVFALVATNLAVLVLWQLVDPMSPKLYDTGEQKLDADRDILLKDEVSVCESSHMTSFYAALYAVHGVVLLFGIFLAWETRKVHIAELNDSRYIGLCIYNMLVPSVVGTALYHSLQNHVTSQYILTSLCQIVATTLTECILFVPKIKKLRETVGRDRRRRHGRACGQNHSSALASSADGAERPARSIHGGARSMDGGAQPARSIDGGDRPARSIDGGEK